MMDRRTFVKQAVGGWAALALGGCTTTGRSVSKKQLPNIVIILADDLGSGDLAGLGAKDMQTPNIDGLFKSGLRFNQFYSNSPVCSPTRASLLTGRYPELVGVPGVIRTNPENSWGRLSKEAVLMPNLLKEAGYKTALIGKWHLGLESPNLPNERGFDYFAGFLGDMMDDYYTHLRGGINYMNINGKPAEPKGHATDVFTEWAIDYIDKQEADKPFLLYLAYNAPHIPIQPPEEFLERVKKREPQLNEKRAKLIAMIEHLDSGVGKVLDALEKKRAVDNTIVIFTSDNGGQADIGASNGKLRGSKGDMFEAGIRVPAAVRWKGVVKEGTATNQAAMTMDILATICQIAKVKAPKEADGISLLDYWKGKTDTIERTIFWTRREGGKEFKGQTSWAARKGDWKLVQNRPGEAYKLFNLAKDPYEAEDLAETQNDVFSDLKELLKRHIQRGESVPWKKPQ